MIYFTLPNFYLYNNLNIKIKEIYKFHPEYFNFNTKLSFSSVDGNFPYFYHNGGDNINFSNEIILSKEQIKEIVREDFHYVLDLSNPYLDVTDYFEVRMNAVLQELETGSNLILINNPQLLIFLSKIYPNYKYIGNTEYYKYDKNKEYLNLLDSIRLNYEDLDNEYYQDISKNKINLNITSKCSKCCKDQQELCYQKHCQSFLMFSEHSDIKDCNKLIKYLDNNKIQNFVKQGYTHFYINTYSVNDYDFVLNLYLNIFIKPEYYSTVKQLLNEVLNV